MPQFNSEIDKMKFPEIEPIVLTSQTFNMFQHEIRTNFTKMSLLIDKLQFRYDFFKDNENISKERDNLVEEFNQILKKYFRIISPESTAILDFEYKDEWNQ